MPKRNDVKIEVRHKSKVSILTSEKKQSAELLKLAHTSRESDVVGFSINPTGWFTWKTAQTQATAQKGGSTVTAALRTVRDIRQ